MSVAMSRGVVVRPGPVGAGSGAYGGAYGGGGVGCCGCRCCTCLNLRFLKTPPGALKLAELCGGALCQLLLLHFGMAGAGTERLGLALPGLLHAASACGLVVWLLLVAYVCSEPSCRLVRASLFEPLFNAVAALLYLSSSSWVAWRVVKFLLPLYQTTVFFESYPAMTSAYMFGIILGILHAVDAFMTYRHYRASSFR